MCPLRFILVFFSAILAAYLAWNSLTSSQEFTSTEDLSQHDNETSTKHKQRFHLLKMMQNGFWVLIDMASGRYLWRSIEQVKQTGSVRVAAS
ncbi:uncharacterized protein [Primulina eburnea]|uniref:uncharacterized protein n=1 Tax=Primulina eburnea TaxID=1245227 RepID=UPI003C6C0AA4